jgi:hypothetical protein
MGISGAAWVGAAVAAAGAVSSADQSRYATNTARDEARKQQEALLKLQSEPMPVADSAQTDAAKRRSIVSQMARRGRASTVLSDPADALGA